MALINQSHAHEELLLWLPLDMLSIRALEGFTWVKNE